MCISVGRENENQRVDRENEIKREIERELSREGGDERERVGKKER